MILSDIPRKNGRTDACETSIVLKEQPNTTLQRNPWIFRCYSQRENQRKVRLYLNIKFQRVSLTTCSKLPARPLRGIIVKNVFSYLYVFFSFSLLNISINYPYILDDLSFGESEVLKYPTHSVWAQYVV